MKAAGNSFLAALVVVALFWGNCFSCPQLLLSLNATGPHSCCKRSAPVARTCTNQVLRHFVKADPVIVTPPLAAPVAVESFTPALPMRDVPVTSDTPHSPPDPAEFSSILRV